MKMYTSPTAPVKKLLFLAIALLWVYSCSNRELSDNSNSSGSNLVLPTKTTSFNTGGPPQSVIFKYNGAKLTEIDNDYGYKDYYTYTGNLITKIVSLCTLNGDTYTYNHTYDSQDRLIKIEVVNQRSVGTPGNSVTNLSWLSSTHVRIDRNVNLSQQYTYDVILNADGSVQSWSGSLSGSSQTFTGNCTYDTLNDIFKNIVGLSKINQFQKVGILNFGGPGEGIVHNLVGCQIDSSLTTYNLQYNSSGYPTTYTYSVSFVGGSTGRGGWDIIEYNHL